MLGCYCTVVNDTHAGAGSGSQAGTGLGQSQRHHRADESQSDENAYNLDLLFFQFNHVSFLLYPFRVAKFPSDLHRNIIIITQLFKFYHR